MKYQKKPITIEAVQWWKFGDHPSVRHYRYLNSRKLVECEHCGRYIQSHGWINTLEGGHIVCPSDWIITGIEGELYPCKNRIFKETYNKINGESD